MSAADPEPVPPEPEPAPASVDLTIETTPPGARIYLDDAPVGRSPVTVAVTPGEHMIRFEDPNHCIHHERVQVGATPARVSVTLQSNQSGRPGARVCPY